MTTSIIIIGAMATILVIAIRHEKRKNDKQNQQPPKSRHYDSKEVHFTRAVDKGFMDWREHIHKERQQVLSQLSHDKPERIKK